MIDILKKIYLHVKNRTVIWRILNHWAIEKERKWLNFERGNDLSIMVRSYGVRMKLYRQDLIAKAIYFENFESREIQFLNEFLCKGDVFVDVGANIGLFTLVASRKVGSTGHVYSFEPSSENYVRLLENINLNYSESIKPLNLGVGGQSQRVKLYHAQNGNGALSSLTKPPDLANFLIEEIEVVSLSGFFQKLGVARINAIKIDVEGWETQVLSGSETLINVGDPPLLLVEFTEQNAINAGFSCQMLYDQLVKLGYSMYEINEGLLLLPSPRKDYYQYSNLICLNSSSTAFDRLRNKIIV